MQSGIETPFAQTDNRRAGSDRGFSPRSPGYACRTAGRGAVLWSVASQDTREGHTQKYVGDSPLQPAARMTMLMGRERRAGAFVLFMRSRRPCPVQMETVSATQQWARLSPASLCSAIRHLSRKQTPLIEPRARSQVYWRRSTPNSRLLIELAS